MFSQASTAAKAYSESMGLLEEITRLQRVYGNLGSDLLASTHILRGNTLFKINRLVRPGHFGILPVHRNEAAIEVSNGGWGGRWMGRGDRLAE